MYTKAELSTRCLMGQTEDLTRADIGRLYPGMNLVADGVWENIVAKRHVAANPNCEKCGEPFSSVPHNPYVTAHECCYRCANAST
jgi:hypothetical protein